MPAQSEEEGGCAASIAVWWMCTIPFTVLFWELGDPSAGGTLLEEVGQWGGAELQVQGYSPTSISGWSSASWSSRNKLYLFLAPPSPAEPSALPSFHEASPEP